VELDLFSLLDKAGGLTRPEAATQLGLADRPTDLLLAACASLGLLRKHGDSYLNSPHADAFLVPGRPCYFGGFVRFLDHREYPAWHQVVTALRTNAPVTWDPTTQASLFDAEDPVMLSLFWEAMHSISAFTGRALVKALPALARHHALLDVGGAMGAIPIEICHAYPALRATVYDLPFVCDLATEKITAAGLHQRISTAPGDFLTDQALPGGHDVIVMSNIMHDWDEATDRALLAKCHAALDPGGTVIICELLLNAERTGPPEAALMGMNMLIETTGGKNHSETDYNAWLADAGFERIEVIHFEAAGANGVVAGHKPLNHHP
jgi:precorrin-6B methylase 2